MSIFVSIVICSLVTAAVVCGTTVSTERHQNMEHLFQPKTQDMNICMEKYAGWKVVAIGDSITRGATALLHKRYYHSFTRMLSVWLPGTEIVTMGTNGRTTEEMLQYLQLHVSETILLNRSHHRDHVGAMVIILGGTNDIYANINPEITINNVIAMHELLWGHDCLTVTITVPPARVFDQTQETTRLKINSGIREFVLKRRSVEKDQKTVLVDAGWALSLDSLCVDRLHLTVAAYNQLGIMIVQEICNASWVHSSKNINIHD